MILGDHELVIAPKYCEKWLVDENKWPRVKQLYKKHICNNRSGNCKKHYKEVLYMHYVTLAECYATHVLDADT